MKIRKVEAIPVRVPLKKPAESAHGLIKHQESLLVKILTQDGGYGVGSVELLEGYDKESTEEAVATIKTRLEPLVIDENYSHVKKIAEKMDSEVEGHHGSKAAIEMALFDLLGKSLGVPVHVLFGGPVRDVIHLNGWIGILDPDRARKEARDWLEKGFRSVKVKMNADVEGARERVEAVRAEGKDALQIRVDANEALDIKGAMETVKALAHLDVFYLEQPFPRHAIQDLITLSKSSTMKIMADESVQDMETLMTLLKQQAVEFVKLKVQKQGGSMKVNQMAEVAKAFGVPVILGHGFGLTISTLAELHIAASSRTIIDGCESVGPFKMADDIVKEPISIAGGTIPVPVKPGLGVELDDEKVRKYRID